MSSKRVNPAGLYDGAAVGMSQATVDLESGFVFVSGQVDWDRDSHIRHATRTRATYEALRERGWTNLRFVNGGMSEWSRRAWPMSKPAR